MPEALISSSLSRSCETNTPTILLRFGRSRVYEAFPYSENIFPFNYEALKTQFLLGFYFYSRKDLESTLYSLFEFLSASLSVKVPHEAGQECFVFLQSVEITTQKSSFMQFCQQKHNSIQVQNSKPPNELNF